MKRWFMLAPKGTFFFTHKSAIRNTWLLILGLVVLALPFVFIPGTRAQRSNLAKNQDSTQSQVPSNKPVYRSPGERHKVLVSDEETARKIEAEGGRLIGDYSSYKVYETTTALTNSLEQDTKTQVRDEDNLIQLNAGILDTTKEDMQANRKAVESFGGKRMHLIQFAGPIKPEWYKSLENTGVHIVSYIASNAYLVYGDYRSLSRVQAFARRANEVQWDGEYKSEYRIDPSIPVRGSRAAAKGAKGSISIQGTQELEGDFSVQLVKDEAENAITLQLIDSLKLAPITGQSEVLNYVNLVVRLTTDSVVQLSKRGDVVSIQARPTPVKFDERQDWIMTGNLTPAPGDYLAYLTGHGFTLSTVASFGVNVSDSGVDNGTQVPNHFGLYRLGDSSNAANSRVVYNRLLGTPNAGSTIQGCDGHGNLNTHIVGGYVPTGVFNGVNFSVFPHADASAFRFGLGVAPFVKVGSSVIFDPDTFTNPDFEDLESRAYADGMRISTNSWGANVGGAYNSDSQRYDALVRDAQPVGSAVPVAGNQEYVIVFSAGNAGSGANTVGSPGTGKNVITVGAAENVQAFGGSDFCGIGDSGADNANDIIFFSSRGPMDDGRIKPDIMAPGTHVSGGVAQQVLSNGSGTGDDLACFTTNGNGVCGGVGTNFFPAGQQYYTASSGTSHSAPAVSGYAALIRQFFINNALTPPSPALTKALMLNTARYMTGAGANDTLPSNNQGMGEANIQSFFDLFTAAHILRDEVPADKFTASGQQRTLTGTVVDNTKPFRVTLVWTDPPGPTSGNAFINNLDLEVTVGGNTYKGNVFSGAFSTPGGVADLRNNVESVFIPAGVSGNFAIKVKGTNIAGNGVPGDGDPLDQDFALVVFNGNEAPAPVIAADGANLIAESCAPPNNAIDPGETVTLNFTLANEGTAATSSLVATLQATGGVTSPSGPQNYGAIAPGGSAARTFTFTADGSCGGTLTATFQLQDGATNLGTVTFTFTLGVLNTVFSENFDGVVPPALPAGWSSSFTNGDGDCTIGGPLCALGTNWTTVNTASDTAPNSAFHNDPSCVTDNALTSPSFSITSTSAQVTFRHTFNLEDTFDGSVLEVSSPNINGGAFTDITNAAVGGSFVTGGYTDTISGSFLSPIANRQAWSGNSGGFITTVANLGPNVQGQTIRLRFRLASDCSVGATGQNIDSIKVTDGFACCGATGTPNIVAGNQALVQESCPPNNGAVDPNERVSVNLELRNTGGAATTNLVATLQSSPNVIAPSGPINYGAIAVGGSAARDFAFTAIANCGDSITLTLQLQDGATNLGTVTFTVPIGTLSPGSPVTFSNPTAITIPSVGVATPYPSNITVAGLPSTIGKVTVTLTNLSHTFPDDIDILLVSPSGRKMIIMSDSGGLNAVTNVTITLDDAAGTAIPDSAALTTGTFRPGNYLTVQDPFAAPAPVGPYLTPQTGGSDTLTSAFTGSAGGNPNGVWSLYVVDDAGGDLGSFAGGWSLTITPLTPSCTVPCGSPNVVVSSTLSRMNATTVVAAITLQNIGAISANNVMLTNAKLGATIGSPLPQSLGSLAPGASVNTVVNFTNSTPGASSTLVIGGTYTGGTFGTTKRVTIP